VPLLHPPPSPRGRRSDGGDGDVVAGSEWLCSHCCLSAVSLAARISVLAVDVCLLSRRLKAVSQEEAVATKS